MSLNLWLVAAMALMAGLVPCGAAIVRGTTAEGLVALELAGTIGVLVLVLLAQGFGRDSYFDVALAAAVLSFPAGLVYAHFLERWL